MYDETVATGEIDPAPAGHNGLVAFVHIPKTAGTTLNAILDREYFPDETYEIMMRGMSLTKPKPVILTKPAISYSKIHRLKSALKRRRSLRLIRGHFDLSLGKLLPPDTRFFTLLRDPVERAISHYYHYRRQTSDPIHALALRSTLEEWVSACGLVEMDNGQTRRLAGAMDRPCGQVTPQMLALAKANLAKKFSVVGLTERFEESLVLLHRAFNWRLYGFGEHNVGNNRPRRTELSKQALRALADANRFDSDLYRFAAALFDKALSKIDMASEIAWLRSAPEYIGPDGVDTPQSERSKL